MVFTRARHLMIFIYLNGHLSYYNSEGNEISKYIYLVRGICRWNLIRAWFFWAKNIKRSELKNGIIFIYRNSLIFIVAQSYLIGSRHQENLKFLVSYLYLFLIHPIVCCSRWHKVVLRCLDNLVLIKIIVHSLRFAISLQVDRLLMGKYVDNIITHYLSSWTNWV